MTELTRRRVLAATGIAGAMATAGCLGSADEGDGNENGDGPNDGEEEPAPAGTRLGEITVENLDDVDHTVDVLVEYDGEIAHWSTHEFDDETGGATLEADWPDERGDFRVTARIDGTDFTQVTPANWSDPDCLNLIVLVRRDGTVRIAGVTEGGPCGSGDVDIEAAETAEGANESDE
ncbi:hypothetical protein [Natronosalvus halobius]|uniref:hypothetical protein n=1 Tax=Natronosalvus halobius TaxID=2953746 RepID=UPI00209D4BD4|nr:hypothetical protein [Natronosalvus halobius]USZ71112.1 hypothetical protein NGM15_13605 [Natronosalvus halobius]